MKQAKQVKQGPKGSKRTRVASGEVSRAEVLQGKVAAGAISQAECDQVRARSSAPLAAAARAPLLPARQPQLSPATPAHRSRLPAAHCAPQMLATMASDPHDDYFPAWNRMSGNRVRLDEPWLPRIEHEGGLKPMKTLASRHGSIDFGMQDGQGATETAPEAQGGGAAAAVAAEGEGAAAAAEAAPAGEASPTEAGAKTAATPGDGDALADDGTPTGSRRASVV